MVDVIDPRLVRLSVDVGGVLKMYEGLAIEATGTKYGNANQNECEVKITNIDKATRDYLLTETSPFNKVKKTKKIILEAGRVSYGYSKIYEGDVTASNVTQPPDISVTLKSLTKDSKKGDIVSRNQAGNAQMSMIANNIAKDNGVTLDFQAKDKTISNYNHTGSALRQVDKLGLMGNVDAFIDDDILVVKDMNVPLNGKVRILNLDTGLIGIPELTDHGIKVKFLLDNQTTVGTALDLKSKLYPTMDGLYVIYKLGFSIMNRDKDFYWIAEAKRI